MLENERVDSFTNKEPVTHIKYARKLPSQSGYPIHDSISMEVAEDDREARTKKKREKGERREKRSKSKRRKEEIEQGTGEPEISPEFLLLQQEIERQLTTSFMGRMKWEDVSKQLEEGV